MRIHLVDAFTDRPFAGNPAGVCLLPAGPWPEDAWMQQIAAELHFSETAFARPLPAGPDAGPDTGAADSAEAEWEIRWFAPLAETNLCGHATLATAHVLRTDRGILGAVRFRSRYSGLLRTHADADGGITLDFPAAPGTETAVPEGLAEALGVVPQATFRTGALGDLLTVLPDEATVRAAAPDLGAVAELTRRAGLRGVILTAPAAEPGRGHDFVSRFFSPAEGILEDPVTGSAHTALAPYWSHRLGRATLTGLQVSARTGRVRTTLCGDRVQLSGTAVTILEGRLHDGALAGARR